jgi:hypothetical protein
MIFTVSNNGLVHKFTLLTLTLNNNQDVWMKVVYDKEEGIKVCIMDITPFYFTWTLVY